MKRTSRHGFTLIELIVTIVILGILAALAVPAFNSVIDRSRQNAVETSGNSIARAAHALAAFDADNDDTVADVLLPGAGADSDANFIADELQDDFPAGATVTAVDATGTPASATVTATNLLIEQGDYEVLVNLDVDPGSHDASTVVASDNTVAGIG